MSLVPINQPCWRNVAAGNVAATASAYFCQQACYAAHNQCLPCTRVGHSQNNNDVAAAAACCAWQCVTVLTGSIHAGESRCKTAAFRLCSTMDCSLQAVCILRLSVSKSLTHRFHVVSPSSHGLHEGGISWPGYCTT